MKNVKKKTPENAGAFPALYSKDVSLEVHKSREYGTKD